jgi:hypothetical protein
MDGWAALYANLSKTAPALAAAATTDSSAPVRPAREEARSYDEDRRSLERRMPQTVVEDFDAEQSSDSDDEVEIEEDELYEVLQGRKQRDQRARKYANTTFLPTPKHYLHRQLSDEGFAERQRLRRYEAEVASRPSSPQSDRYVVPRVSITRSTSLPTIHPPSPTTPEPPTAEDISPKLPVSKPKKARPAPLDLVPRSKSPALTDKLLPNSPYPSSILSLYSPQRSPASPSRTLSLPAYSFQASDLPSPGRIRTSSPIVLPSATISSPRSSLGSTGSGRTSISSSHRDSPDMWCQMPTPPLPSVLLPSKKDRIYNLLNPGDIVRQNVKNKM